MSLPEPQDPNTIAHNALETLEKIRSSLESLGSNVRPVTPEPSKGVADQGIEAPARSSRLLSPIEMTALRSELRKRTTNELFAIFAEQGRQKNVGVPVEMWLANGGSPLQNSFNNLMAHAVEPDIAKLAETTSVAALIRQDLEPVLYELFIRVFPAFERFPKEPANGLTHTFNQMTDFGGAEFMAELGTVTDDKSTYVRQTTPIGILATRRGVSLKSQFATLQSGSGFNPEQLELMGGLRAISNRMQNQIFSGHSTDSGGTASNELGEYDPNAFTGLRSILNSARVKNVDPEATAPADDMRRPVNQAVVEALQQGLTGSLIAYLNPFEKETIDAQQDKNVRYTENRVNVGVGVTANVINTANGELPLFVVPGNAISSYTATNTYAGNTVRDIYLVNEESMSLPWLGSEGPTVLDIPIGISGQLTHLYIIFGMWGLAAKAPTFSNKVRVKVA